MSTVEQIESAVTSLSQDDLAKFRDWFAEFDHAAWDRKIEADSAAGKLDSLINEALTEDRAGRTRPW